MHVGQRGYRHEECSIGIKWWREDRSEVRCSDLSPTLMPQTAHADRLIANRWNMHLTALLHIYKFNTRDVFDHFSWLVLDIWLSLRCRSGHREIEVSYSLIWRKGPFIVELPSYIISPSHVVFINISNIKNYGLSRSLIWTRREKREETEGDRDDLLEEREETLPRISLHLKKATMLTTVCWKAKHQHQHPLDKFE